MSADGARHPGAGPPPGPLRWDSLLVAGVAAELRARLEGARLRAFALDRDSRTLSLFFRESTLTVGLHPERAGLDLSGAAAPSPEARPLAARLADVQAPIDDRVLLLDFQRERGRRSPWLFAVHLIPSRENVVVTEGEERWIRHILLEHAPGSGLQVGEAYAPPERPPREGVDGSLTRERWRELLLAVAPARRRAALLRSVAWTSPLNAEALLGRPATDTVDEAHAAWQGLLAAAQRSEPVLLEPGVLSQPYPAALPGVAGVPFSSLLEAFAAAAAARGTTWTPAIPGRWLARLVDAVARLERRAGSLARQLAEAPEPGTLRGVGDLLLARYREVPKGVERVALTGFEGETVDVELDPSLPPQDNAARYYEEAARAGRARERLPGMIEAARQRTAELRGLLDRARAGEASADEVERALPDASPGKGRSTAGSGLPYRTFRSSSGLEIRVGKGARSNDELTFRHAGPDDVWLHARHAAGAHVVLRWAREDGPPARDLAEAAVLAALHSRARTSGSVPVDWTRRKYVRKPRKAPPGRVVMERAQTVFVEPDEALLERLAGSDPTSP